jgi:hypothetical protein
MAQQTHQHISLTRVGAFVCVAAAACLVWASAARAGDDLSCIGAALQAPETRPLWLSSKSRLASFTMDIEPIDVPGVVGVYPMHGPAALRGGAYEPYPLANGVFGLDLVWLGKRGEQHILPVHVGYDRGFHGTLTIPHRGVTALLCNVLGDSLCRALLPRHVVTLAGTCEQTPGLPPFSASPPAFDSLPTWWENWAEPTPLLADNVDPD